MARSVFVSIDFKFSSSFLHAMACFMHWVGSMFRIVALDHIQVADFHINSSNFLPKIQPQTREIT